MKTRNKKIIWGVAIGLSLFVGSIIVIGIVSHHTATQMRASEQGGDLPYGNISANIKNNIEYQIQGVQKDQSELTKNSMQQIADLKQAFLEFQRHKEQNEKTSTKKSGVQYNANGQVTAGTGNKTGSEDDSITKKLVQMSDSIKQQIMSMRANTSQEIKAINEKLDSDIKVGSGDQSMGHVPSEEKYHWVDDLSVMQTGGVLDNQSQGNRNPLKESLNLFGEEIKKNNIYDDRGHYKGDEHNVDSDTMKPTFTAPNPTVMSNAIALTPMVGRIPKGENHAITSPYKVVFVVEHPNLVSNNHQLASQLGKMMGIATCTGVYGSIIDRTGYNRCKVNTLTYIFPDGTISTQTVKNLKNPPTEDDGLGYITDAYGNPQIGGALETSIGLRIAMIAATTGASAYGGALATANTLVSNTTAGSIMQQVTNTNKYALGQSMNAAAQGVNKEWKDISANFFDFVFTPKWDKGTHKMKRFNIIITHELHFDYDTKGRKLNYGGNDENTEAHLIF